MNKKLRLSARHENRSNNFNEVSGVELDARSFRWKARFPVGPAFGYAARKRCVNN